MVKNIASRYHAIPNPDVIPILGRDRDCRQSQGPHLCLTWCQSWWKYPISTSPGPTLCGVMFPWSLRHKCCSHKAQVQGIELQPNRKDWDFYGTKRDQTGPNGTTESRQKLIHAFSICFDSLARQPTILGIKIPNSFDYPICNHK